MTITSIASRHGLLLANIISVVAYEKELAYVGRRRRSGRETFIPLVHDPGHRVEADFGHIYVDFPEGRRQVPVLVLAWAYSHFPFAIALPTERTEAILHGMQAAFEFYDCVPREIWWDNPKTVTTQILTGRRRKLHDRYAAFASLYNFDPLFCMPARGNKKPHAENRVKNLQRRWATDVGKLRTCGQPLAAPPQDSAPVSQSTLLRQIPKVGAVCGNSARTDLRGGHP